MNAKQRFLFTVHRNTEFDRLIDNLINTGVIDLGKIDSAYKVEIQKVDVFYEIFSIIFLQYSTPDISNIVLSKETQQIILKGDNIGYILEDISSEALEILTILITKEDDADYENAFNALICVCLGSIKPCKFIFPNTYITELGRDTHEFDVFACTNEDKYIIVESTRGFDKKVDNIDESYTWHFKKAVFRKWMVEKIYSIECKLVYISLKEVLSGSSSKPSLPEELNEEAAILDESRDNELISKLLQVEGNNISIIDFNENTLMSLNKEKIINSVYNEIYKKLSEACS